MKKKAGRPRRADNPQRLLIHLPGELKKWLRIHAITAERSVSSIVSEALTDWRKRAGRSGHGTR